MSVPKLRFKEDDGSEFPEWKENKLGDVISLLRGSSPRPIIDYITTGPDGVNWIKIGDMPEQGNVVTEIHEKITREGAKKSRYVSKGDIILSNSMSFGKPYILNIDGYIHDGWFVIKNYNDNFLRDYLLQSLVSHPVQFQYKRMSTGGVVQNISSDIVNSVKINIPCFEEQQKIAYFLSILDQVINQIQSEIDSWEKQKRAVMRLLFSREVRFNADDGGVFPEWTEKKIQDVCTVTNGKGNTQDKHDDGDYAFFVRSDKVEHSDNYLYDKEAVITIGDGNIGKVYHYFKGKFNLHQRCYAMFDFKNVSGKYFYYYFSAHFLQRVQKLSAKGTVDSVRMNFITDMNIMIPCLAEQQKIAACLSAFDDVIDKSKKELDAYRELKKGLLQQMFV